ncbi:MAG: hypothetical protein V1799_04025 [bacterium]
MLRFITLLSGILVFQVSAQTGVPALSGFSTSPYFNEQVRSLRFNPEVSILINAPAATQFDPSKRVILALYALPNGNIIEQTIGKTLKPGDDWHFNIQHIGAQTRFLREYVSDYNFVVAYLMTDQKSWPAWKGKHPDYPIIIQSIVDSLKGMFHAFTTSIVLTGHSGGGSFTFGYLDGVEEIPGDVERIVFLDSNYGYKEQYAGKFVKWLNASARHILCVIAYNDSIALLNGKRFVSDSGGTWFRSKLMQRDLAQSISFDLKEDTSFILYTGFNKRVQFILKHNPQRLIYHTVQVDLNGFIHGMLIATMLEGLGYDYFGSRVYSKWIHTELPQLPAMRIPPRLKDAPGGSVFMDLVKNLSFEEREMRIYNELARGNIPDFLRKTLSVTLVGSDRLGKQSTVTIEAMPDFLAIGSDDDFCRIPMGPITAQRLADLFTATLPTRKLVDEIYRNAAVKLDPVPYLPVGNTNETVEKFIEHNRAIERQRAQAGAGLGALVAGIKKDVVLSNKLIDSARTHHVTIYGWHRLDGAPIQPLTNIHIDRYVDYSHGIRLLKATVVIDSTVYQMSEVLRNSILYKLISDEQGPMVRTRY